MQLNVQDTCFNKESCEPSDGITGNEAAELFIPLRRTFAFKQKTPILGGSVHFVAPSVHKLVMFERKNKWEDDEFRVSKVYVR